MKYVGLRLWMVLFAGLLALPVAGLAQDDEPEAAAEEAVNGAMAEASDDLKNAASQLAEGDVSAALPLVEKYVIPAATALLILVIAYFIGKFLARVTSAPIERKVDETLGRFAGKLVFYIIMIFALLGVLGKFGISVASFAAVLAAAGFAIGMAFQGTLGNFASGILLLVFRPYKVGDVVNAAGITAKVVEIDLFTTVFDTFDNRRIIVPNGAIAGDTIENITHHPERRVDVDVGVEYGADIQKTRDVLSAAAESMGDLMVQGEGRGYAVTLGELGDSAVTWTVRVWAKKEEFLDVKQKLTQAVKEHLDEAGLGIPFPQMDVHVVKED